MAQNGQCYYGWLSIIDRRECWSIEETKWPCRRSRLHQEINISTLHSTPGNVVQKVLDMRHVVDPVVKIVNYIRTRGLNHRQFTKLLEDCDSDHRGVPYHTAVGLSVGKVLRRVWDLKTEILLFLEIKVKAKDFLHLKESKRLSDLAFAVDLIEHMKELNTKIQGKGTFAHEM